MTFIIAIQAADSIVISADRQLFGLDRDNGQLIVKPKMIKKMHSWAQGVITATGEHLIFQRIYKQLTQQGEIALSVSHLQQQMQARVKEIGVHSQIELTKLIYSQRLATHPQLYILSQSEIKAMQFNSIEIFSVHLDIQPIINDLRNLQALILAKQNFLSAQAWLNHYLYPLQKIYHKLNRVDAGISACFDVYFQDEVAGQIFHVTESKFENDY